MIWRRPLLVALLTITGLAVSTSLFGTMTLVGAKPELLLLMTVALAMGEGAGLGATAGFFMGLATDLTLNLPHGVSALSFTLVGATVGTIRPLFSTPSAWLPMGMVSVATFCGVVFYGGFAFVLGEDSLAPSRIALRALLAAAYNALLTPFLFPIVRSLAARLRPASAVMMR